MADEFAPQIAALTHGVPIVMLPVRLEARYFNNGTELRVRIFPDQIHVDAHETELTAAERDAGMAYWRARFESPDVKTRTTTPWGTLCGVVGAARAAWIVRALAPTNIAQIGKTPTPTFPTITLRSGEWSRAARAAALPKRWLVMGTYAGDGYDSTSQFPFELFRKWTNEVSPSLELTIAPDATTSPPDGALPLQPAARWLADFDEAERLGMAVRITPADAKNGYSLRAIERLWVVGVDWTLTPDAGAAALRQLMCSHVYTDGLAGIDPGTPTNVTNAARPGASPSEDAMVLALDPEKHPLAGSVTGFAADRLWRSLGIIPTADDLLTTYPGANSIEQFLTSHLVNALWESTLGSYAIDFMSPLFDDASLADLRDHARKYLQPGGPFPTLRIGRQPYGVQPILPQRIGFGVKADTPFEDKMLKWVVELEQIWALGMDRVPHLGRTKLDADVTQILQTTPLSSTYRFRPVLGPLAVNATNDLRTFAEVQELTARILWSFFRLPDAPPMSGFAIHPASSPLRVPLVDQNPIVPGARISVNYLQAIADLARTDGTYDSIKKREDAATLLEALIAHATSRELHRADMRTINTFRLATGQIAALPAVGILQAAEYIGIEPVSRPDPATGVLVTTQSEASRVIIPSVTGQQTVRQFVTAAVKRGATVPADYRTLADMLASIEWVATRPAEQIERSLRGVLDACSHRLDAWVTSLATRRLATVRAAKPTGVYLGGYGWLESLRPSTSPISQGYLHAPSLPQAATAAVLRSGHLAHNDAEHKALDLNLTSNRVRTAMQILDGVSQGQPLTALLGYRFERSLRAINIIFAKYILPFRRLVPLRPDGGAAAPAAASPSDNIAARDVVDGVALIDRWRAEGPALLALLAPAPSEDDKSVLGNVLDMLADTYDAVADVMVAEAVHQNVLGNGERAGAVLAALDRQETPPTMDFVRTPRSGKSFTHRVLVLIGDEVVPATWSGIPLDARANAEPRLNAWIARLIGDPKRVKFSAAASASTQTLTATLSELLLSPLSLVMAAQAAGKDSPSELEERIVALIAAKVTAPTPATEISLLDAVPAGSDPSVIGLGALRSLLRWIYTLITSQRSATANDLSLPQDGDDDGLDTAQIATRANAVAAAFGGVITVLDRVTATPPSPTALRDALWSAAAFGVRSAVPAMPPLGDATGGDRDELLAQARDVLEDMRGLAAREAALVASFVAASAAPAAIVAHHVERMRLLLGGHFPILPRFAARNASVLAASVGDRPTLCGGDDLAPSAWLQRMALVRAGVGRLSRVLSGAEMLQSGISPSDLRVVQLPRAATTGERWLALPFAGVVPEAELSIAAASSGVIDFTKPLAGLYCDAWPEVVPSREETTGLAFHYDAPGARPPQAVLVAVPPETTTAAWSTSAILETVMEGHRLARMRGVGPAELRWMGTVLPALSLPFSFSDDVPAVQFEGLAAKYAAANAPTANILGKS